MCALQKKSLYLFRHGETDWNKAERFQGHTDIALNEQGRKQAQALITPLKKVKLDVILSSDLTRAQETANILASVLKIPVIVDSDLREANLGKAEGLTRSEIEKKFGKELARRWASTHVGDLHIAYPGGESGLLVLQRVLHTMEQFALSSNFEKIGICTHGGVIRRVVQHLLGYGNTLVPIPNGILYPLCFHIDRLEWNLESTIPFVSNFVQKRAQPRDQ